jgi:hypothetical protein
MSIGLSCGSWNEAGMVNSLSRKGFTGNNCGAELIANCIDARSTKAKWDIIDKNNEKKIRLTDYGTGMNSKSIDSMFDIFRQNHANDESMGVSGLGGKEASLLFSKKEDGSYSKVLMFTRENGGEYLKITIPWDEIVQEKQYTGKIQKEKMTDDEIHDFCENRVNMRCTGTTIVWDYTESFYEILENQFNKSKRETCLEHNNRWDIIFGKQSIDIVYDRSDGNGEQLLKLYDYFSGQSIDYFNGKSLYKIVHYKDDKQKEQFIYEDDNGNEYWVPIIQGGHYSKQNIVPKRVPLNWTQITTITAQIGMRKDKQIFDEQSNRPKIISTSNTILNDYDKQFFSIKNNDISTHCNKKSGVKATTNKTDLQDELSKLSVYRNGQRVTSLQPNKTVRGNAASMKKGFHMRTEINYYVNSSQDNLTDIAFGIQECKTQNQNKLPPALMRLIEYFQKLKYEEIEQHFRDVIKNKNSPHIPAIECDPHTGPSEESDNEPKSSRPSEESDNEPKSSRRSEESDNESKSSIKSYDGDNDSKTSTAQSEESDTELDASMIVNPRSPLAIKSKDQESFIPQKPPISIKDHYLPIKNLNKVSVDQIPHVDEKKVEFTGQNKLSDMTKKELLEYLEYNLIENDPRITKIIEVL